MPRRQVSQPLPRTYRYWTYPEVLKLRYMVSDGHTDYDIGQTLGRSENAIECKRNRLKIGKVSRVPLRIIKQIQRLSILGYYDREIGKEINKSRSWVCQLRLRHGIKSGRLRRAPK